MTLPLPSRKITPSYARLSLWLTSIRASFRCCPTKIVRRRWIGLRGRSGSVNEHVYQNPMGELGTRRWKPIKVSLWLRAGLRVMKVPLPAAKGTSAFANG